MNEVGGPQEQNPDDLFLAALKLSPDERTILLDASCGNNQELREEVEALLAIADKRPDLLSPNDVGLIPETLGRYELIRECGRGGMGIVFEAKDTQLLRIVALKVLPQFLSREEKNLKRFQREAQTLAGLNHTNIATMFSLEENKGFHYLTMEYIEGITLAEVLARRTLSVAETLSLGLQVALALEAAHSLGFCHCDLKPANIMVSPCGKITVLDFGIARVFEQIIGSPRSMGPHFPSLSFAAGTPDYMAPEQIAGQTVNKLTDMWAYGAILYECLTGERLCLLVDGDDTNRGAKTLDLFHENLSKKVPDKLVDLIESCREPNPENRPPSATTLREVCDSLLRTDLPRWRIWGALVGAFAVVVVALFLVFGGGPGPLTRVKKVEKDSLTGFDSNEKILWRKQFNASIRQFHLIQQTDMRTGPDSSFHTVGLAVTTTFDGGNSQLNFLDIKNGHILWTHIPAWSLPVNALGPIQYRWTKQTDWPGQSFPVIINGIRDGMWYGFAVEAVGVSGDVLGVYHHPGPLVNYSIPLDKGKGNQELLFYGANSSARFNKKLVPFETQHHPGCVVLLKPGYFSGQAFPYSENLPEDRDWPDVPKARESAYLLVSMITPDLDSVIDQIEIRRLPSGQPGYTAVTRDGRFVLLDENLYPLKCVIARNTESAEAYLSGKASLAPYLYIRDGITEWVDVPIEY